MVRLSDLENIEGVGYRIEDLNVWIDKDGRGS